MKTKIIASVLALTTVLSVGYPIASKAMEKNGLEKTEVETSSTNENDETLNSDSNESVKEELTSDSNESDEESVKDEENKSDDVELKEETIEENNISLETKPQKEETKVNQKVKSVSEAAKLMKLHNKEYFDNLSSNYVLLEDKGYRVDSIRNEFGITNNNMVDEPAYIINLMDTSTGEMLFRYAAGCNTGKVYFGAYGFPKAYEIEHDACRGEYSNGSTYIPQ